MRHIKIENFKCFHEAAIPLSKLTVFAGANGNGKSTAIQSLLFLRKTIEHCAKWENGRFDYSEPNGLNVELNGSYCLDLGNSDYVIPVDSNIRDAVTLGLLDERNEFTVTYSTNTGQELWLTPTGIAGSYRDNPLCYQEFYYLNAERIGPRMSQHIKFYDYPNVGFKGEYTAQIISNLNWNFKVEDARINSENLLGSRFEHYINAWLEFILPGVAVASHFDDKTHTARIEVQSSYSKGYAVAPTNTGFGISYVLPVIVSGLIAKKDRLLIVENPEAHLHPSAQSKIGQFLAVVANAGVNVIVETHSDHVINGIQIAVARQKIMPENVCINFFQHDNNANQPCVTAIGIKEKGELTDWPKGFFDQTQADYLHLIQLRRNV
jgi:predicted ATPase